MAKQAITNEMAQDAIVVTGDENERRLVAVKIGQCVQFVCNLLPSAGRW